MAANQTRDVSLTFGGNIFLQLKGMDPDMAQVTAQFRTPTMHLGGITRYSH